MKISVIYPVCSYPFPSDKDGHAHPFLLSSLNSIISAGNCDYEILIGIDGFRPNVISYVEYWRDNNKLSQEQVKIFVFPFTGQFGNPQRNQLISKATGQYISFMDQDDAFAPNAFEAISSVAITHPDRPMLFKMKISQLQGTSFGKKDPLILWKSEYLGRIEKGLIGGHIFVVPNRKLLLSTWPDNVYEADFYFVEKTIENFKKINKDIIWVDFVLAEIRPWAYVKDLAHYENFEQ
jgi:hypothetical protein